MSFVFYDVVFLVIFCSFVAGFLYVNRKKVHRDGWMYLYKTQVGIKFINYVGDNYKKTLRVVQYLAITLGYFLMAVMMFFLVQSVYIYLKYPQIIKLVKAPPIAPVLPYFPKLYGMESFFPPFYFTYFILSILIIAVVHEFSHGILARRSKVRIKSTGFAFLGPFIGAFVEQDDRDMVKRPIRNQLGILAGGVFANIITGIFFLLIMYAYMSVAFFQNGVIFQDYIYSSFNQSHLQEIEGISVSDQPILDIIDKIDGSFVVPGTNKTMLVLNTSDGGYLIEEKFLRQQIKEKNGYFIGYNDFPAIKSGLTGAIIEVNGQKIRNDADLANALRSTTAYQNVEIKTKVNDKVKTYQITLEQHPLNNSRGLLGIASSMPKKNSVSRVILGVMNLIENPGINYEAKFDRELAIFIRHLLWWIVILNFLVALGNMLPLGPFDGGRFFMLTVLAITRNEKIAKKSFKMISAAILAIVVLLMVFWAAAFFR